MAGRNEPGVRRIGTRRPGMLTSERGTSWTQTTHTNQPLSAEMVQRIHAYWRAANYLRRADLLIRQPAAQAPVEGNISSRACSAIGDHAGAEFHLCPSQSHHQGAGSSGALHCRAWSWRTRLVAVSILKAPTAKVYPNISQDEAGSSGCSNSFHSPAAFRAMSHRKRPAPFTRVASWDIPGPCLWRGLRSS